MSYVKSRGGRNCAVPFCHNSARKSTIDKTSLLSFHNFPSEKKLLNIWLRKIKSGKKPSKWSQICSAHFKDEDFLKRNDGRTLRRRLKCNAVPSMNLPCRSFSEATVVQRPEERAKRCENRSNDFEMRRFCVVAGCSSSSTRNRGLRFYKFPNRPIIFDKWKDFVDLTWREVPYQHESHHRICEKHFRSGKTKSARKIPKIFLPHTDTSDSDGTSDHDCSGSTFDPTTMGVRVKTEPIDPSEEAPDRTIISNNETLIIPEVNENWSYETGVSKLSGISVKEEETEETRDCDFHLLVKTEVTDAEETMENWDAKVEDLPSEDATTENSELQYLRNLIIAKDALINQLMKDISRYKRLVNDLVKNNHELKSEVDYLQRNK